MTDTSAILPQQYIVLFDKEPDALHHTYQTIVEPFNTTSFNIEAFKAKGLELVASIETAAREERLGLHSRKNGITGVRGLIIEERWQTHDATVTNVIAELLAEWPHELNDIAKNQFDYLCWSAFHQNLSVVVHANGPGGKRVAFASLVKRTSEDEDLHLEYLARLLLTESEISQWSAR